MDNNNLAVHVFNKLAEDYQKKFMDVEAYHNSFDIFCESIKTPNAAILELACGPGNITQYLLNKRPDFIIQGTDLAENMIALAQINNPSVEFKVLDCRAIDCLSQKFDGIMCGFGLPYLSKEEAIKLILDAANILKPDGVLYLSTMEDDYSKSGLKRGSSGDELYIYYHQADYLTEALATNNFKIIDLQRQDYQFPDGSKNIDLLIIAKKLGKS